VRVRACMHCTAVAPCVDRRVVSLLGSICGSALRAHVAAAAAAAALSHVRPTRPLSLPRLVQSCMHAPETTASAVHLRALRPWCDAQTSIPPGLCRAVQAAFKDSLFPKDCMSQYVSHLAAFFIVARAKRSIVKSCSLFLPAVSHISSSLLHVLWPGRPQLAAHSSPLIPLGSTVCVCDSVMILPQVHLRKPCYDFYFL
jgi:hypothetical protein